MPRPTLPLLLLVVAMLAAGSAVSMLAASRPAFATKDYARTEELDCGHCHINPKGAGPRTARGREYEANGHRFGVKSWSSDANRETYLRANSSLLATWYGEADRLLDAVEKKETLPGGLALIEGTRKRYRMFARSWLGAARKLLEKGRRGEPHAVGKFLVRLETQFAGTEQGKEATRLLDELAESDAKKRALVEEARAAEAVRVVFLEARTEHELGHIERARALLAKVLADERGKPHHDACREILEHIVATEAATGAESEAGGGDAGDHPAPADASGRAADR